MQNAETPGISTDEPTKNAMVEHNEVNVMDNPLDERAFAKRTESSYSSAHCERVRVYESTTMTASLYILSIVGDAHLVFGAEFRSSFGAKASSASYYISRQSDYKVFKASSPTTEYKSTAFTAHQSVGSTDRVLNSYRRPRHQAK